MSGILDPMILLFRNSEYKRLGPQQAPNNLVTKGTGILRQDDEDITSKMKKRQRNNNRKHSPRFDFVEQKVTIKISE